MRCVVLVPGLGLGGVELWLLRYRLRRTGFTVRIFYYWPWSHSFEGCVQRLERFLTAIAGQEVDMVAHSLGGLVAIAVCHAHPTAQPRRVVTLGTPHNGSQVATRLLRFPGGSWLLSRALTTALQRVPLPCPTHCHIGAIAGRLDTGIGWLLGLRTRNDSLVSVAEAHHPAAVDTLAIAASHATLLISRRAAGEVAHFLHSGTFQHDSDQR